AGGAVWRSSGNHSLVAARGGGLLLLGMAALCLFAAPLRAADVTLPSALPIAGIGGVADVPVSITGAAGLEGADIHIAYDATYVRVAADAVAGDITAGCMPVTNSSTLGVLQVGVACSGPLTNGDGTLFKVTFS